MSKLVSLGDSPLRKTMLPTKIAGETEELRGDFQPDQVCDEDQEPSKKSALFYCDNPK